METSFRWIAGYVFPCCSSVYDILLTYYMVYLGNRLQKKKKKKKKALVYLLKGYREEVDKLPRGPRFLNIYQKLYEAPDPFPALASVVVITGARA